MHQLLQRCVRERIVKQTDPVGRSHADDAGSIAGLRSVLGREFVYSRGSAKWAWLRTWLQTVRDATLDGAR